MTNSQKPDGYPDNNPKTAIGVSKVPLHYIPPVALVHLGLAMEDGGGKYGLMNWREFTVSASVYYDAMFRHLMAWWDGEDAAPDSGVHHLGHVMACAAIILDAAETTRLNDDRPDIDGQVAALLARHAEARKAKLTVPEPGPIIPIPPIDLPDFRKGLRDLAAREAGVSVGELNMFGRKADKPPGDANNDDLKHWSRENQPLPRAPLMRQGLRIKGSELWFEDTVIVPDLDRVLIPSDVGRLIDLVDGIDGEPHPARWADVHDPEG
jgi:hypothetical protein